MWFAVGAFFLTVGIVLCVCGLVACCAPKRFQNL